ncbi:hypothetical protein ACTXT7_003580 [Hymenolepis weldensis]
MSSELKNSSNIPNKNLHTDTAGKNEVRGRNGGITTTVKKVQHFLTRFSSISIKSVNSLKSGSYGLRKNFVFVSSWEDP